MKLKFAGCFRDKTDSGAVSLDYCQFRDWCCSRCEVHWTSAGDRAGAAWASSLATGALVSAALKPLKCPTDEREKWKKINKKNMCKEKKKAATEKGWILNKKYKCFSTKARKKSWRVSLMEKRKISETSVSWSCKGKRNTGKRRQMLGRLADWRRNANGGLWWRAEDASKREKEREKTTSIFFLCGFLALYPIAREAKRSTVWNDWNDSHWMHMRKWQWAPIDWMQSWCCSHVHDGTFPSPFYF